MNLYIIRSLRILYKPFDFLHRALNKVLCRKSHKAWLTDKYVEYFDQQGNDLIYRTIKAGKPAMICKFGTYELWYTIAYFLNKYDSSCRNQLDAIRGLVNVDKKVALKPLCSNAGFFPCDISFADKYAELVLNDFKSVDILASYIMQEKYISTLNSCVKRVNLDALYAPYRFKKPWSSCLEGKKVVVIHPFVETIASQYEKRQLLFKDETVLPHFASLHFIKAVQSIGGNQTNYSDWFKALEYMENELDKLDYDIVLIGCGAYGFNLAAYAKRQGKIAIHLAGWTQMLFGIYGNRWKDDPRYSSFINEYWVRPSLGETPKNATKIENACYW